VTLATAGVKIADRSAANSDINDSAHSNWGLLLQTLIETEITVIGRGFTKGRGSESKDCDCRGTSIPFDIKVSGISVVLAQLYYT
jgi:hypothetical protein